MKTIRHVHTSWQRGFAYVFLVPYSDFRGRMIYAMRFKHALNVLEHKLNDTFSGFANLFVAKSHTELWRTEDTSFLFAMSPERIEEKVEEIGTWIAEAFVQEEVWILSQEVDYLSAVHKSYQGIRDVESRLRRNDEGAYVRRRLLETICSMCVGEDGKKRAVKWDAVLKYLKEQDKINCNAASAELTGLISQRLVHKYGDSGYEDVIITDKGVSSIDFDLYECVGGLNGELELLRGAILRTGTLPDEQKNTICGRIEAIRRKLATGVNVSEACVDWHKIEDAVRNSDCTEIVEAVAARIVLSSRPRQLLLPFRDELD